MKINRKIFMGVQSGAGYMAVSILLTLIQFRIVLEFLPKDLAGIWFIFLNVGTYVSFFDLGVSPTLSREISFVLGQNIEISAQEGQIADLITTCSKLFKILSITIFFLVFILGGLYLNAITREKFGNILLAWLVFSLGASMNLLNGGWFASLIGMGNVATERLIRTVTQILGFLLSVSLLYLDWGILGLSIAWALQGTAGRVISKRVLFHYYPFLRSRGVASIAIARNIVRPSLKWAAMALGAILILQTDNIIIASTLGPKAVPPYEAVAKLTTVLMTLSMLIVNSSTPFLSKLYSAQEKEEFNRLMLRNIRYSMALMAMLTSFLAVFGDQVINVWLGPENFVGFSVLWTFLAMLVLETHHVAFATATMAAGHIIFGWIALSSGILNIIFSLILVKYMGLWGVALGTLVAQMLTNNWYVPYKTLRIFDISFKSYTRLIFAPIIGLVPILLTINFGIRYLTTSLSELNSVIISFSLSIILGLFVIGTLLMQHKEKKFLQNYILNFSFNKLRNL